MTIEIINDSPLQGGVAKGNSTRKNCVITTFEQIQMSILFKLSFY